MRFCASADKNQRSSAAAEIKSEETGKEKSVRLCGGLPGYGRSRDEHIRFLNGYGKIVA
jgi:hypothetical protein